MSFTFIDQYFKMLEQTQGDNVEDLSMWTYCQNVK